MSEVWLRKNRRRRLEMGHPWVYKSEIADVKGEPKRAEVVVVKNHQGHYLATGFYHPDSQIAVRIATYDDKEVIDKGWLKRRVTAAFAYRKRFLPRVDFCRAIYGEADGLPGLIVDKYGSIAVVQVLSAAMEARRTWIAPVLKDILGVNSVYERSDAPTRLMEGLEPSEGCLLGECPKEVEVMENGLKFWVDIVSGQKTGHFFDQRENRAAIAPIVRFSAAEKPRPDLRYEEPPGDLDRRENIHKMAKTNGNRHGATVLDCFCHTGGFAMHALLYGASHVTLVDSSEHAIVTAKQNAEANNFSDRCEFVVANAFDQLRTYEQEGRTFDVVILDPPAFAKTKGAVEGALRGYKEINLRGLKLVAEGGFLVTASCSYHVSPDVWKEVIADAAQDARKILRLVEYRSAAKDHPQLFSMPENDYLKFAIFMVQSR